MLSLFFVVFSFVFASRQQHPMKWSINLRQCCFFFLHFTSYPSTNNEKANKIPANLNSPMALFTTHRQQTQGTREDEREMEKEWRPFIIANWRSHENFVTVLYYFAQILRIKNYTHPFMNMISVFYLLNAGRFKFFFDDAHNEHSRLFRCDRV